MQAKCGNWSIALLILKLRARWEGWSTPWSGCFTPRKWSWYLQYNRLGGKPGWTVWRRKNLSPPQGSNPQTINSVAPAKCEYLQESWHPYCSCPSLLQFPLTGLPAVRKQQPYTGTWETPASASLQSAWLQQINMSATFRNRRWSMPGNYPPSPH